MKNILILGGTQFVGRVLVETLLEQTDYNITLFNRGKTNPDLFPDVERIVGDRLTDDIEQIGQKEWDCVIDISGYYPLPLEKQLQLLEGKVGRYIYISTVSVYDTTYTKDKRITELFPTLPCTKEQKAMKAHEAYGQLKAECERVILTHPDIDSIILRLSLVYGKYNPFDRVYTWLYRMQHQDRIILPGMCNHKDAYTFVEDLAQIIIKAIDIEKHRTIYNTCTHQPLSLKKILGNMAVSLGKYIDFEHVSPDWLNQNLEGGIHQSFPLYLGGNYMNFDNTHLQEDFQLTFHPIIDSFKKTVEFYVKQDWRKPKSGISLEKEQEILKQVDEI